MLDACGFIAVLGLPERFGVRFLATVGTLIIALVTPAKSIGDEIEFERDIAPLILSKCVECHQANHRSGGLSLTAHTEIAAGGDSGPAVNVNDPASSLLIERIQNGEMPPPQQGLSHALSPAEVKLLTAWIAEGMTWPEGRILDLFERTSDKRAGRDWWSLQPIVRPQIPILQSQTQPENPIDTFVFRRLEETGVSPAPMASRRTLIRRLYFDLLGLPPREGEIEEFLDDDNFHAWPKLVDRILSLPQYGERWGRYWLDLARYADTSGYERDQEKPFAWKYRDWVVRAFNQDMPYTQFVLEQLAGDEIADRTESSVIATGFLRLGTWNDEPNDKQDYQYERLEDLVHTTSSTFLALTVKCARCHNHKFDAITQDDYYRMASAFWPGPLLNSPGPVGGPSEEQVGYQDVLAWTDTTSNPSALHLLRNGERNQPMHEVIPASLSCIPGLEVTFSPPPAGARTTHRRLQLAAWINDPKNPLTARVIVNRIWQHHFGEGLVRTPNNYGFLADPPTHPKLLDWLASEFIDNGYRIKPIHRLILNSKTWQQSSKHPNRAELELTDASNRLLWRANRRRMDAETLRDSLLAVSGELDRTVGGPPFKATISPEALEGLSRKTTAWEASEEQDQYRRSIYMYLKRGLLPPMMTAFDLAEGTVSCGKRNVTTVPTQALVMLNNDFVHDRSQSLARSINAISSLPDTQAKLAWLSVLQRTPSDAELRRSIDHLTHQRKLYQTTSRLERSGDRYQVSPTLPPSQSLVLSLDASDAVSSGAPDYRVASITDQSGRGHHAFQKQINAQPRLVTNAINDEPALSFDGKGQYLKLTDQVLEDQPCTIVVVATDHKGAGHRALISNWNGSAQNSTTSLFLGLTGESTVRFSDAFGSAGSVPVPHKPFVLTAVNSSASAVVYHNGKRLKQSGMLPQRKLDTSWVIGQQGNINGEFWMGHIAVIRVYDRALTATELNLVHQSLAKRYNIDCRPAEQSLDNDPPDPTIRALASLCHVLMNTNEFIFID